MRIPRPRGAYIHSTASVSAQPTSHTRRRLTPDLTRAHCSRASSLRTARTSSDSDSNRTAPSRRPNHAPGQPASIPCNQPSSTQRTFRSLHAMQGGTAPGLVPCPDQLPLALAGPSPLAVPGREPAALAELRLAVSETEDILRSFVSGQVFWRRCWGKSVSMGQGWRAGRTDGGRGVEEAVAGARR